MPDLGQRQIDSAIRKEELEPELELELKQEGGTNENRPPALSDSDLREEAVNELADRPAIPVTRSNVELLAAMLKVIKTKHAFAADAGCFAFLEGCVKNARAGHHQKLEFKPGFFFEDGDYENWRPLSPEIQAQLDDLKHAAQISDCHCYGWKVVEVPGKEMAAPRYKCQATDAAKPPECIVGKCLGCGRPRLESSSWSDYCADSCRDAHKRATA